MGIGQWGGREFKGFARRQAPEWGWESVRLAEVGVQWQGDRGWSA